MRTSLIGPCLVTAILLVSTPAMSQTATEQSADPKTPPASQPASSQPATTAPDDVDAGVDEKAIALAERTMHTMGGRAAWNQTRYLAWEFFGRRYLVWDKKLNRVRVEFLQADFNAVVVLDLATQTCLAWRDGEVITNKHALKDFAERANGAWVNDSYWLVLPYKLRDPGVALKHMGTRPMLDGRDADVLRLTYDGDTGLTPHNMYDVYVAKDSGLVGQWDFFRDAANDEPNFQLPWTNWKRYGGIVLSDGRGTPNPAISRLSVHNELPETVFTAVDAVDLSTHDSALPAIDLTPTTAPATGGGSESGGA